MRKDGALEDTCMDHVDSVENRVQALLQSNEASFNDWLLLIAEIEDSSPDDMQKICIVYDSFLSEYPLCYGYWTRFAGHKARLCTMNDVEDVYERAVKIASHSVHLWVSYCKFATLSFEDPADVRRLFERGLSYVHKDYLCHLLWDIYIEYEYCQKQWKRLAHIYINTLRFPTRRLRNYYESFKKLVALLEEQMGYQNAAAACPEAVLNCEMTLMKDCVYSDFSNAVDFLGEILAGPEALKKYLAIGELLYHNSMQLDKSISCFETHIHRPFFHIMPLDDFQLQNWHKYLTFVEEQGNFNWTVKLYERCLIPCANYSEFWIRYVDFADDKGGREIANDALERALRIFLKRIPAFHPYYLLFKEKIGDAVNARALLQSSDDCAIDVVENVSRNANMEKRLGNIEAAQEIYDKAIKLAYEKQSLKSLTLLYINFARFTFVVTGRVDAANEVFIKGIQKLPCKLIIEEFLNFVTMHGGANHLLTVDCMIADLISSESNVFLALSPHDREGISQIYLKFVDLHGTIFESRQAWDRHRKLFPHILRPLSVCDYSSKGFKFQSKKSVESKVMQTKSHNHSNENPNKNILDKNLVENHSSINTLITLPEAALNCELESNVKADNVKKSQESLEAETTNVHELSIPTESEMNTMNKPAIESRNESKMLNAISEYHDGEMPVKGCIKKINNENLELPTLDNLTICSKDYETMQTRTISSDDNNTPQETASKEDGSKSAVNGSDCEGLVMHLSGEKNLKFDFESEEKREDGDFPSISANLSPEIMNSDFESPRSGIKEEAQLKFQEKMNSNLALPANSEHPPTSADGGQWAHISFGAQCIPVPNSVLQGYIQSFQSQQWQALGQLQNQSGMTNQQMPLIQSFTSQTASVPNSQDPQASYTQFQYQLAASQAYTNPDPAFLEHCMQQSAVIYTPDQQFQHPPYQTQIQLYQNASQSDDWYSYYQSAQGFPPHIWQYYQNLYYLQQQQLQQRQQDQQLNNSNKNQLIDLSEARNIEQELHENQVGQVQLQVQIDTLQHHRNLDEKLNVTGLQQNQQDKQYEPAQSIQQSVQTMNSEQSQCLYLQQQQNYYMQQQQYQLYLQQQQQQQPQQQQQQQQQQPQQQQQQQQHQQFLHFHQQQLLYQQKQLQQQRPILPLQQHQPLYLQQQHQAPMQQQDYQQHQAPMQQQDYQQQQQPNALELKPVAAYSQGKGDPLPSAEHLAISPTKQSDNSPNH